MKWLINSIRSDIVSFFYGMAFLCAIFTFLIIAGYTTAPRFLTIVQPQIALMVVLSAVIAYIIVAKVRGKMSNIYGLSKYAPIMDPSVGPIDRERHPNRYATLMMMWIGLAVVLAIAIVLSFVYPL